MRVITLAVLAFAAGSSMGAVDPTTTSSVFQIQGDRIVFPEWDKRTTEPVSLVAIGVNDFPGREPYRERIVVNEKTFSTKEFQVPEQATTLTITARSRVAADIFPHLKINLVSADGQRHMLFDGYWQTLSMETYWWKLPAGVAGKKVKLDIEMLNGGTAEDYRLWYFMKANIY